MLLQNRKSTHLLSASSHISLDPLAIIKGNPRSLHLFPKASLTSVTVRKRSEGGVGVGGWEGLIYLQSSHPTAPVIPLAHGLPADPQSFPMAGTSPTQKGLPPFSAPYSQGASVVWVLLKDCAGPAAPACSPSWETLSTVLFIGNNW